MSSQTSRISTTFTFSQSETLKQPKSPRSPRAKLENPLLKSSAFFFQAPALVSEYERSPTVNIPNRVHRMVQATPGPPPKASLSLDMKLSEPKKDTTEQLISSPKQFNTESPRVLACVDEIAPQQEPLQHDQLCQNWVIAYGFTNEKESRQLLEVLRSFGSILSTTVKPNGNWIAVQFEDELCAARASARQVIQLPFAMCGVCRATPQFLQNLLAKPLGEIDAPVASGKSPGHPSVPMGEEEILVGYSLCARQGTSVEQRPRSICDRIFYWYFNWGNIDSKCHQD